MHTALCGRFGLRDFTGKLMLEFIWGFRLYSSSNEWDWNPRETDMLLNRAKLPHKILLHYGGTLERQTLTIALIKQWTILSYRQATTGSTFGRLYQPEVFTGW